MPQTLWFLLLPGFSMMGLMAAIEPLRVANRFRGELYRWHVLSADGGAVLASNGMSVNADAALESLKKGATLWVVAGFEPLKFVTPALERWLHRLDNEGVTLGGIDTREVSSKTMESQKAPGLYFIGEVLDVSGHLGGFNFQWAWASAYAAAQFV
mgnify:CR=1 FL=1